MSRPSFEAILDTRLGDAGLSPRDAWVAADSREYRPKVLMFDSRADVVATWAESLAARCELASAHDAQSVDAALAIGEIDVVVAGMKDGLAELVQRLPQGTQLIFCGAELPESVVEAVTKGYKLTYVESVHDLQKKIFAVTRSQRSVATRFKLDDLIVRTEGIKSPLSLLEISNHGFSFGLAAEEELEPFLPGAVLGPIEVRRGPTVAMSGVKVIVRHVEVSDNPDFAYRIGCSFLPPEGVVLPGGFHVIDDRAQCAGLVRSALRGEGIELESTNAQGYPVHCSEGQVDLAKGTWSATAGEQSFAAHEIVRGHFETGGRVYTFFTTVIEHQPLSLGLPLAIEERNHRHSGRYMVSAKNPIMVELSTPLFVAPLLRPIRDLSSTGFSFDVNLKYDLFPVGMHFSQIVISSGGQKFQCRGRIKNLTAYPGRKKTLRCGVEFEDLTEKTRVALTDFVMRSRFPGIEDGRTVGFDEWLQFFRDTGFFSPEKAAALEPLMPEVKRMYESLTARPTKLFKSVVAREGGKVVGHMSGLRAYSKTWMFHHLAALPGNNVGHLVSLGGNECFDQGEHEYFKAWFHSDVRWPNRVFGGMAKKVNDAHLSELRRYSHFVLPTTWSCEPPAGVQVIEAVGNDLSVVERHFVKSEKGLLLRADDLTRAELNLNTVNASYRTLGMQRRRRVFLALRNDTPVGIGLAEVSSPGLNLSEGLSSFRLYLIDEGIPFAADVRRALLNSLMPVYRQAGRPYALGLFPSEDAPQYVAMGFDAGKDSLCWTAHRSLYQQIFNHIERLFEVLKKRQARNLATARKNRAPA